MSISGYTPCSNPCSGHVSFILALTSWGFEKSGTPHEPVHYMNRIRNLDILQCQIMPGYQLLGMHLWAYPTENKKPKAEPLLTKKKRIEEQEHIATTWFLGTVNQSNLLVTCSKDQKNWWLLNPPEASTTRIDGTPWSCWTSERRAVSRANVKASSFIRDGSTARQNGCFLTYGHPKPFPSLPVMAEATVVNLHSDLDTYLTWNWEMRD